jgi:hypothetical protein
VASKSRDIPESECKGGGVDRFLASLFYIDIDIDIDSPRCECQGVVEQFMASLFYEDVQAERQPLSVNVKGPGGYAG